MAGWFGSSSCAVVAFFQDKAAVYGCSISWGICFAFKDKSCDTTMLKRVVLSFHGNLSSFPLLNINQPIIELIFLILGPFWFQEIKERPRDGNLKRKVVLEQYNFGPRGIHLISSQTQMNRCWSLTVTLNRPRLKTEERKISS